MRFSVFFLFGDFSFQCQKLSSGLPFYLHPSKTIVGTFDGL